MSGVGRSCTLFASLISVILWCWTFQNQWSLGGSINFNTDAFDDRLTRGGPGGRTEGNVNGWQYFNTSSNAMITSPAPSIG